MVRIIPLDVVLAARMSHHLAWDAVPNPSTLAVFVAAAMALILVPGPNHVYIVTRSLSEGRRAGVASAFGVETGTLVHSAATAIGLAALIASSATAFRVVQYLGAAYLIYLGLRKLLSGGTGTGNGQPDLRGRGSLRRVYLEGMAVNVLNPKVALFFLALLPQFVDPAAGSVPVQLFTLGVVMAMLGLSVDLLYALGAGSVGAWTRGRLNLQRSQRYLSGLVYLGLGVATALASPGRRG